MEVGKRQGYWVRDKGLPCLQHSKWHDLHIQVPARARGGTGRWALVGTAAARLYQSWGDSTQETQIFIRMLQANLPQKKRLSLLYRTANKLPLVPKGDTILSEKYSRPEQKPAPWLLGRVAAPTCEISQLRILVFSSFLVFGRIKWDRTQESA